MEWDTPIDRMLRERVAKARERAAAKALKAGVAEPPEAEAETRSEPVIIMPNPQKG